MIAVYAMGGGLGHVARARRVLKALSGSRAAIFTATPLASGPEIVRVPRRLARSRAEFGAWLKETLRALAPSTVVVDAFPLGILGELADRSVLPDARLVHVARVLRWDAYRAAFPGAPRRYDASYAVEDLTSEHERFLREHSAVFAQLELTAGISRRAEDPFARLRQEGRPIWLLAHSGPQREVDALFALARETARREGVRPRYVAAAPRARGLPGDALRIEHFAVADLFPFADRIVTACGFNSMLEAAPYRARHLYLPLERRFDDQFLRAARQSRAFAAGRGH